MSKKSALLIGCNYTSTPSARLSGCINDIVNVRAMLIDAYGYPVESITMLRDDDASSMPTLANIMAALATILGKSGAKDEIWIHYSGHGSQLRDAITWGDEEDGMDETIVPCDFVKNGMIVDDALFGLLQTAHPQASIFICFDCCHSGSAFDLQYACNYDKTTSTSTISTVQGGKKLSSIPNVYFFSGCRDAQTSADAYSNLEKLSVGAFTDAFIESLRKYNHSIDIVSLYNAICQKLIATRYSQIPVLCSSSQDFTFTFRRSNASASVPSPALVPSPVVPVPVPAPVPVPVPAPVPAPVSAPTSSSKPGKVTVISYKLDPHTGKYVLVATPAHLKFANKMVFP